MRVMDIGIASWVYTIYIDFVLILAITNTDYVPVCADTVGHLQTLIYILYSGTYEKTHEMEWTVFMWLAENLRWVNIWIPRLVNTKVFMSVAKNLGGVKHGDTGGK
jgi:hypothetical protein